MRRWQRSEISRSSLRGAATVGIGRAQIELFSLLQSSNTNFKELIEVGGKNRQKPQAFKKGKTRVFRELKDAVVELNE